MKAEQRWTVAEPSVGPRFLQAMAARDFVSMTSCFNVNARFRALIPSGLQQTVGGREAANFFYHWFGAADRVELLDAREASICDRRRLSWRVRVHDHLGRRLVEQHAFVTIQDDRFIEMDMLCSGFRTEGPLPASTTPEMDGTDISVADVLEGGDANCATLTPLIRTRLRDLSSGEVLEVVTSEPTAEQDISSWSNLTGNALVGMRSRGLEKRFYVRKK